VRFTEWFSTLSEETLSFQVLAAFGALKALAVVVVVEGLHPAVPGLYREAAAHTLGGEQVVPICFTVRKTILKVEGARPEHFAAISAAETFWMELLSHRVQAIPLDPLIALAAGGREELLVAVLAVEAALLLHEAHVQQLPLAGARVALEVVGAPVLAQRRHERPSDLLLAAGAHWNPGADGGVHDAPAPLGGCGGGSGALVGHGAAGTGGTGGLGRGGAQAGNARGFRHASKHRGWCRCRSRSSSGSGSGSWGRSWLEGRSGNWSRGWGWTCVFAGLGRCKLGFRFNRAS